MKPASADLSAPWFLSARPTCLSDDVAGADDRDNDDDPVHWLLGPAGPPPRPVGPGDPPTPGISGDDLPEWPVRDPGQHADLPWPSAVADGTPINDPDKSPHGREAVWHDQLDGYAFVATERDAHLLEIAWEGLKP